MPAPLPLLRLLRQRRRERRDMRDWALRAYASPAPMHIKRSVLLRLGLPDATWIETGTYYGDTTALLSRSAKSVISIEPAQQLAARAVRRFRAASNVRIVFGSSEECLGAELAGVRGDANFWLDGHYSGGPTYCGATECPVNAELTCIAAARPRLGRIVVLIDDARMFGCGEPRHPDYPPLDDLVAWARSQGLTWHVEHDIFVARTAD